ncbi:Uncharacterized protein Adt_20517 [Abeliophyllum distichum]|uniref:Uncharacterized protein n=1 Tax=Abeliophyllum distichum TaxID=126358 RepID=A0ABD1SWU9_9LAMI
MAMDFREPPCYLKKFMEFLVVDTCSTYHGVLRRPALKDLQIVTSIHHLAMKFLTFGSLAMIRDLEQADEDMMLDEGLDPRIIGPDSSASLAKELETFPANTSDPS